MTRASLAATLVALGMVCMLAFVGFKSQSLDFQDHSRYQAALVELQELDARLDVDVLESRWEIATSYDGLVATLAEMRATERSLLIAPAFLSDEARAELAELLAAHVQAVDEKGLLIERFKSENAIVRNSLHYLPVVFRDLNAADARGVNDVVRDVLLYNLTGDAETARRVHAGLDGLATDDDTTATYHVRMLSAHAGIILRSKPVLDRLLAGMVQAPTRVTADALEVTYTRDYEAALTSTTTFRSVLILVAIGLAACIAFVGLRLRRATVALQHLAHHDGLTQLPNRTLLHRRLEASTLRGQEDAQPMALLLMDLDRFKEVNDTLGHHAGDELLRQVARRVQSTLRVVDTVARLGGDEFAMLLPGADVIAAQAAATSILDVLAKPFAIEGCMLQIGASIGISLFLEHGDDAETLLRHVDSALYVAKRAQSGAVVYTPELAPLRVEGEQIAA